MHRVISKDGTPIVSEAVGTGPAVVLVGGGLDDGSENAPLAGARRTLEGRPHMAEPTVVAPLLERFFGLR
jgi:hypothetical protein